MAEIESSPEKPSPRSLRSARANETDECVNEAQQPAGYSLRMTSKRPNRYSDASFDTSGVNYSDEVDGQKRTPAKSRRGVKRSTLGKGQAISGGEAAFCSAEALLQVDNGNGNYVGVNIADGAKKENKGLFEKTSVTGLSAASWSGGDKKDWNDMTRVASGTGSSRRLGRPPKTTIASLGTADLSTILKDNLRRLKNVLKLPKARRWVYCEFFYSGVDRQLFLVDNEFCQCLRESFPNLKCRHLARTEWRTVRRLIGKPRRCSQAFFDEERAALEMKRAKIRQIYEGTLVSMTSDMAELPSRLPRSLIVGAKIYARVRSPKDGIYSGTIDAVLPDSYRVVFDKEEMIPAMIINDSEVMAECPEDVASLTYFLEQNRAAMPNAMMKLGPGAQLLSPSKILGTGGGTDQSSPLLKHDPMVGSMGMHPKAGGVSHRRVVGGVRDEKVGNFPVRMLVMLVKLAKLIEMKRGMVRQLTELNAEAERINMLSDSYLHSFQEKYAQLVVDLETLNKQMAAYLTGINEYNAMLLPHLSEVTVTSRPEALRKLCYTHSVQIVKHCNQGLNVQSRRTLDLITSLTALLLQVRSLGQQPCTAHDLHTLSESLAEIRLQVVPNNAAAFQDNVEVHMKQIHNMMLQGGAGL